MRIFAITLVLFLPQKEGRCDFFGGDLPLLIQIVANTAQQLIKLKSIIQNGEQNLGLLRDINRGINDSLNLIRTVFPNIDPGIYRGWEQANGALREIERIFGPVVNSPEAHIQHDTDQSVAEAIALNNSIYKYSRDMDEIGETIKSYSHSVSPGGAQKLTAQSLGVMLNVLNQGLRAQATGLKLQAQTLALQNHREKEMTKHMIDAGDVLKSSMSAQPTTFQLPRF